MSTLVVYGTRYGSTARLAAELAKRIPGARLGDLAAPARERRDMLRDAEAVVIGGPIYGGRLLGSVTRFCESHRELVLSRRVGLFITCLERGERAREELATAFPDWLTAHAQSRRILGGEARLSEMRWLDRYLFRKVAGQTEDVVRVDEAQIQALAEEMA